MSVIGLGMPGNPEMLILAVIIGVIIAVVVAVRSSSGTPHQGHPPQYPPPHQGQPPQYQQPPQGQPPQYQQPPSGQPPEQPPLSPNQQSPGT